MPAPLASLPEPLTLTLSLKKRYQLYLSYAIQSGLAESYTNNITRSLSTRLLF